MPNLTPQFVAALALSGAYAVALAATGANHPNIVISGERATSTVRADFGRVSLIANALARDLGAVHLNTTFADLPKEVQSAITGSTRAAFNRLLKEGYTVAKGAPPSRTPPTGSRPPRTDGPPRGPRPPGRGPGKPPIVETKCPPRGGGPGGGGRGGPARGR